MSLTLGRPEVLISGDYSSADRHTYDISPDGRFLMMKFPDQVEETDEQTTLVVVENWFEELNRLAPPAE
jgi:hypothetical protein